MTLQQIPVKTHPTFLFEILSREIVHQYNRMKLWQKTDFTAEKVSETLNLLAELQKYCEKQKNWDDICTMANWISDNYHRFNPILIES